MEYDLKLHLEKIEELYEKYKDFFESSEFRRGIEIGPGWIKHTEWFLEKLQWHKENNLKKDEKIVCLQIKEKFGDLRVYIEYPERLNWLIERTIGNFEGMCYLTCYSCGQLHENGVRNKNGWLLSQCNECFKK